MTTSIRRRLDRLEAQHVSPTAIRVFHLIGTPAEVEAIEAEADAAERAGARVILVHYV